jgi:hypothetical protein
MSKIMRQLVAIERTLVIESSHCSLTYMRQQVNTLIVLAYAIYQRRVVHPVLHASYMLHG